MTFDEQAIHLQRKEYAEASPAKRQYLDTSRAQRIAANGGKLPPRTWAGPENDPTWLEAERSCLIAQRQVQVDAALAVLAVLFVPPLSLSVQEALAETVAAAHNREPNSPELQALKQHLINLKSMPSTPEGGSK
jgi:hypothetical protein